MKVIELNNLNQDQVIKLNILSKDLIKDFNEFSGDLLNLYKDSVDWLLHSVNSRNLYHSDLFLHLCFVELLKDELKPGHNYDRLIVPNNVFKKIILKNSKVYHTKDLNITVKTNYKRKKEILKFIKNLYKLYKMFYCRHTKRINNIPKYTKIILIDTFILNNSYNAGKYIDRYYTGLLELIPENLKNQIFFLPTIIPIHQKKKINTIYNNSDEQLLFHCDFLKLRDYFYAISYPLRLLNKRVNKEKSIFNGVNVSPLINRELNRKRSDLMMIRSLMNYRLIKRIKQKNIDLKLVIDWYENQSIDKGMILGIRTQYPEISIKGYQGIIVATNYSFYVQPTMYEQEIGLVPDEILVPGRGLIPVIKKFNESLIVHETPALRFSGVWKNEKENFNTSNNKKILVALPIGQIELKEILDLVFEAIKNDSGLSLYNFIIKAHPTTNIHILQKEYKSNWPGNAIIKDGDFASIMLSSDLLIGNSSSVCVEAIAHGKPVIIIGSQSNITQNPIPDSISSDIHCEVYTTQELGASIKRLLAFANDNIERITKISKDVKKYYFEPISKKKLLKLFSITNDR